MATTPADPVGIIEIADRLGVKQRTPHLWRFQNKLPAHDYDSVNGTPAWEWRTILAWAGETGRLRNDQVRAQYEKMFGTDPPPARFGGPIPGTKSARRRSSDNPDARTARAV